MRLRRIRTTDENTDASCLQRELATRQAALNPDGIRGIKFLSTLCDFVVILAIIGLLLSLKRCPKIADICAWDPLFEGVRKFRPPRSRRNRAIGFGSPGVGNNSSQLASCAFGAETPTPILGRMSRNCTFCMICILTWQSRYQNPGVENTRLMNGRPTDARPPYASSLFSPALSVARNCAHFTRNTADKHLDFSFLCTELEIALLFPPKLGAGAIAWGHGRTKLGAGAIAWGANRARLPILRASKSLT